MKIVLVFWVFVYPELVLCVEEMENLRHGGRWWLEGGEMTVAFPFSSSCHGCFIHGLLLCLGGYFRSSKGDGLGIMHDLGETI